MAKKAKATAPTERERDRFPGSAVQAATLIDNRSAAAAQRRLATLAELSPRAVAQRAHADSIDNSPRLIAQMAQAAQLTIGPHAENTRSDDADVAQFKTIKVDNEEPETEVNWVGGNLAGSSETVGTGMAATNLHYGNVDEGELVGSTPRASAQKTLMGKLPTAPRNSSINKFIKGHLLNHNIGGPGLDYNMFPITASANSLHHSFVEKTIKKWVLKDKETVNYSVNVSLNSDQSNAQPKSGHVNSIFRCQAENLGTKEKLSGDIVSEFGTKATAEDTKFTGVKITDEFSDNLNYSENSFFGQIFKAVEQEDDQSKVDEIVVNTAYEVVDWVIKNMGKEELAKQIVSEAFNTKGKRFTGRQQEALVEIAIDVFEAFVTNNDKSDQEDHENDYPTLIKMLKK